MRRPVERPWRRPPSAPFSQVCECRKTRSLARTALGSSARRCATGQSNETVLSRRLRSGQGRPRPSLSVTRVRHPLHGRPTSDLRIPPNRRIFAIGHTGNSGKDAMALIEKSTFLRWRMSTGLLASVAGSVEVYRGDQTAEVSLSEMPLVF